MCSWKFLSYCQKRYVAPQWIWLLNLVSKKPKKNTLTEFYYLFLEYGFIGQIFCAIPEFWCFIVLPEMGILNHSHESFSLVNVLKYFCKLCKLGLIVWTLHVTYSTSCGCHEIFQVNNLACVRFWNICQIFHIWNFLFLEFCHWLFRLFFSSSSIIDFEDIQFLLYDFHLIHRLAMSWKNIVDSEGCPYS